MTKDMDESKRRTILGPKITEQIKKINREQLNKFMTILEKKSAIQIMNYAHNKDSSRKN